MSEVFAEYFSSVFDATDPAHPAEHQSSASIILPLILRYNGVL